MTRARISILMAVVVCGLLVPAAPALSEPPSNDVFVGAIEIDPGALPYTESRDTTEATTDDDDTEINQFCGALGAPATDASVWYSITPTDDTTLAASTFGTDYSAGVVTVVTGEPGSFDVVTCWARGVVFEAEAGVTYYVVVFDDQGDGGGNGGQLELKVEVPVAVCGPPGQQLPATIVGSGVIRGTPGDDVIVGSAGNDRILGRGGNDVLCGEGGNDVMDGGNGNDVLIGDGDDLPPFAPSNGQNDDDLSGGPGNDLIVGLGGDDRLRGNTGDDTLLGMGGYDNMNGGPGDDFLFGGPLDDEMRGDAGNDTLVGNFGSDMLSGGAGDDFLNGDPPSGNVEPPFPPGGNDDTCKGGSGTNEIVNCESII